MLGTPLWYEVLVYLLCGWLAAIAGMFVGMWLAR
jgi:ribose/xylose/arabinose/galactoside ABC-type transport system permease subunit